MKIKSIAFKILKPFIPKNVLNPLLGISKLASVGKNSYLYKTTIDDFTYLSSNVTMMNTKVGKFCSIGQGVCVSLGIHPSSTFVSTHPAFFSLHEKCGTTFATENHFREMGNSVIGNDVWIGVNAIIMDDVIVNDGAIVGAGAIVTKDVPPYAIVVGNPAKVIKYRFEKDEIEFLLDFKWWDKDPVWIKDNYIKFHNIGQFKKDLS